MVRVLAEGKANKEIAQDLGLSEETVKTYVKRILAKLQARSRTQAAMRAMSLGLFDR